MRTDPRQLHGEAFDVVVVGASLQGAAVAREAAARGLRALLVDAEDVAAGTSSCGSGWIHDGAPALRRPGRGSWQDASRERERLLRSAAHLVRPLPILMPVFDDGAAPLWRLQLGAWLHRRAARRSTLPRPRRRSASRAVAAFPGLRTAGLRGAVELFDARADYARLAVENVRDAASLGAAFCSYARVASCGPSGLTLVADGAEVDVRCRQVVNAAGADVDAVRRALGVDERDLVHTFRAAGAVLPPRTGELALCALLPDGRVPFVVPEDGGARCGAAGHEGDEAAGAASAVADALGSLLEAAPSIEHMVSGRDAWGPTSAAARALARGRQAAPVVDELIACGRLHSVVQDHAAAHRAVAERVVAAAFGCDPDASPTRSRPLPGGVGPREVDDPLWWRYGGRVGEVRALAVGALREPLCEHRPFLACELVHAVTCDGATTFADAMVRRLVDVRGPCREPRCLERARGVFERAGGRLTGGASPSEMLPRAGAMSPTEHS